MSLKTALVLLLLSAMGCVRPGAPPPEARPVLSPAQRAAFARSLARERARGAAEARADIAEGALKLLVIGRVPACQRRFARLMEDRYQVKVEFKGCLTTDMLEAYVGGYNDVAETSLRERHGPKVLEETEAEAGCAG